MSPLAALQPRWAWLLVPALLAVAVLVWYWLPTGADTRAAPREASREPGEKPEGARQRRAPRLLAARSQAAHGEQEVAGDGVPIMAARGDSTDDGPRHPHPITPEHRRIFRENQLLGSLNGAMDVGDYEGLRELNEQYKEEYPEDSPGLQEGYDLLADCLQERTSDSRARAERYFREERASTLRRYVRRHCLR